MALPMVSACTVLLVRFPTPLATAVFLALPVTTSLLVFALSASLVPRPSPLAAPLAILAVLASTLSPPPLLVSARLALLVRLPTLLPLVALPALTVLTS
jgi:hypothetical protein